MSDQHKVTPTSQDQAVTGSLSTETSTIDDPNMVKPEGGSVSFTFGKTVVFRAEDSDMAIVVDGSIWSGRETVTVNGDEMSRMRSFKFSTAHNFDYNGEAITVIFTMADLSGTSEVLIIRDGKLWARRRTNLMEQRTAVKNRSFKYRAISFTYRAISIAIGFVAGFGTVVGGVFLFKFLFS